MEVAVSPPPIVERVYSLEQRVEALSIELERRAEELDAERARVDELQDEVDRLLEEGDSPFGDSGVDDALMQALLQLPPAMQHARITDVHGALGVAPPAVITPTMTGASAESPPRLPSNDAYSQPVRDAPPTYHEAPLHVKLEQQRHQAERDEVRDALETALALPEPPELSGRERAWKWLSKRTSLAADWILGRKPIR
jgi:hypothetical protein